MKRRATNIWWLLSWLTRNALDVYTREQLPQEWAATQNSLGSALQDMAARTEGPKGTELLAQAISAFRSSLEIYVSKLFGSTWPKVGKAKLIVNPARAAVIVFSYPTGLLFL